jgi:hypothetical protein
MLLPRGLRCTLGFSSTAAWAGSAVEHCHWTGPCLCGALRLLVSLVEACFRKGRRRRQDVALANLWAMHTPAPRPEPLSRGLGGLGHGSAAQPQGSRRGQATSSTHPGPAHRVTYSFSTHPVLYGHPRGHVPAAAHLAKHALCWPGSTSALRTSSSQTASNGGMQASAKCAL